MSLENGKVGVTLTGMPGSGKSAIGRRLQMPGWIFHDHDNDWMESPSIWLGKDGVADKIRKEGDIKFLEFENEFTIKNYWRRGEKKNFHLDRMIFASSWSLPRSEEAMKHIQERTHVIFLEMPIDYVLENIKKRCDGATRIVGMNGWPNKEAPIHITLEEELSFREKLYKENCDSIFLSGPGEKIDLRVKRFRLFLEEILWEKL